MEHIKKIHNSIFVSDRIITYKAAAAILEINSNEAKKILEKYVNDLANKDETLNVTYVIGGVSLTDQNKVKIVPQNKYKTAKSCFKTITIDHIYSIQKSPLTDWTPICNVDDFLYDKNEPSTEVTVKQEVVESPITKKEVKTPQPANKKGGISTFFNNANNQKKTANQKPSTEAVKKVENGNHDNKTKKQEKSTAFTNYFKSSNKENEVKVNGKVKKEQVDDDDDEEIFKVTKKRSRVLNDDEEDDVNPTKCPKVDILDDPMEEDEHKDEYHSDEDIFGSPEKDEELMKDTDESTEKDTPIFPETCTETTDTNSETIETSENNTETTENNTETTENSETMYEDDDGYFVTEKKKPGPKSVKAKQESKKETKEKKKVEKEEKKSKKEVVQKIKNNTNQKSILSFFQKK